MKKVILLVTVLAVVISISFTSVYATETDIFFEAQQIAENRIDTYGVFTVCSTVPLYNTELKLEAICFNFAPYGYVIVNVNDYSVPEFSPYSNSPYLMSMDDASKYIYVGPLNYYSYAGNDVFVNLQTGVNVVKEEFDYEYSVEKNTAQRQKALTTKANLRGSTVEIRTDYLPVTWTSSYYCGVDACAIVLKYLDAHHEGTLLSTSMDETSELHKYLVDKKYIPNTSTYASDLVLGTQNSEYTGLNDFFSDRRSSFEAIYEPYIDSNTSDIVASINADLPVIIGTDPADDWNYGNHWVIIYGCVIGTDSYFLINDGWGSNGIYVTTEDDHYDDYICFEK